MAFNPNQQFNYQGYDFQFDTPERRALYQQQAMNGINPYGADPYAARDLGYDAYRQMGYTGNSTWDYGDQINMGSAPVMSNELSNWLQAKGYNWGLGAKGADRLSGYFDATGKPVGNLYQGTESGDFWKAMLPVAMFAGGAGLAGQFSGGGGAAGAGSGAAGELGSIVGPAMGGDAGSGIIASQVGGAGSGAAGGLSGIMGPAQSGGVLPGGAGPAVTPALPAVGSGAAGSIPGTNIPSGAIAGEGVPGSVPPSSGPISMPGTPVTAPNPVGGSSVPGGTPGTPPAGGTGMTLNDIWNRLTSQQGITSILGLINAMNQQNSWKDQIDQLNTLYSPNSDYANQMKEELARKDAAAGRNSQYGPRAANLAAMLTDKRARAINDMTTLRNNSNTSQNNMLQSLIGLFGPALVSGGAGGGSQGTSIIGNLDDIINGFQDLWDLF